MPLEGAEGSGGSFEYFDHAADLGIRVAAPSLPELFAAAVRAVMNWIGPAPQGAELEIEVRLEAEDLEGLLVRWLQEALYIFQQRRVYVTGVKRLELDGARLEAVLAGRAWDEEDRRSFSEVKAVTYHKLEVRQEESGWCARIVLDI